jgi:predicted NBD/HSP70 family sugar kinase/predicted transcriptional regulator
MENEMKGKNQSYNRAFNNALVIDYLKKEGSASATTLSQKLNLSNAAMSSILKDLSLRGLIQVEKATSLTGKGRKQIEYVLNSTYGLIVVVSIANYHCKIVISNIKEEVLESSEHEVPQYDSSAIYRIVLDISKALLENQFRDIPLRNIVISLPGRVNSETGELAMSPQFDKEIFKSDNFIVDVFQKQFPDVPIYLANDIKLSMVAEKSQGGIVDGKNAMLISVDTGVGGAFSINGKLFLGDQGYAGEFGLIHGSSNGRYLPIDEFISLRALQEQVGVQIGHKIDFKELAALYRSDEQVKAYILTSAHILGRTLNDIIALLDISTIILSGRVMTFGEDYLKGIRAELTGLPNKAVVEFSRLGNDATILGAIETGVRYILDKSVEK